MIQPLFVRLVNNNRSIYPQERAAMAICPLRLMVWYCISLWVSRAKCNGQNASLSLSLVASRFTFDSRFRVSPITYLLPSIILPGWRCCAAPACNSFGPDKHTRPPPRRGIIRLVLTAPVIYLLLLLLLWFFYNVIIVTHVDVRYHIWTYNSH